ncbi:carboxymuconolactone decarboxylase family protein [Runella sp. SP2]|uniref:carboxymuconolactone decarboxylase family protein n=1 Tax=Runella sp. SP2 TaxID=2268026 RepID=UPI000F07ADED|nr:carboxymuconolactone decarboxylase family protein [Runella sp. SP2]AYQ35969.1 carboxymuconolactone decarboxylase family protein [Runella sp. SP2]
MSNRVKIQNAFPEAWKAMYGVETTLANTNIPLTTKELMKVRASQLNQCAFCIDMHATSALKNGETAKRLLLLDAWKETDFFSEEEKAALAIVEDITLIHQGGLSEATYQNAQKYYDEKSIAQLIMVSVVINSWNRIAISTQLPVAK